MHVGVADQAAEPPSALCLFQCLVVQPARSPHARGGCDRVVAFPSWASLQAASVTKPRRSCVPMRSKRVDSRHGRPREWTSSVRAPGWPCRAQRGPNWQPREPCGRWWSRNRGMPGNRPSPSLPSSQSGADAVVTRRPSPCRAVNAPSACGRPCSSMRHSGQCVPGFAPRVRWHNDGALRGRCARDAGLAGAQRLAQFPRAGHPARSQGCQQTLGQGIRISHA